MTAITATTSTFRPDTFPTVDLFAAARGMALSATHAVSGLAHATVDAASRPATYRGACEAWACVAFAAAGISLHFMMG